MRLLRLKSLVLFASVSAISCGGRERPEPSNRPTRSCASEAIPELPEIAPEDLAGPEEGCPEKFEICVSPATAAKIEMYHERLRRAALVNRELCEPVPGVAGALR